MHIMVVFILLDFISYEMSRRILLLVRNKINPMCSLLQNAVKTHSKNPPCYGLIILTACSLSAKFLRYAEIDESYMMHAYFIDLAFTPKL